MQHHQIKSAADVLMRARKRIAKGHCKHAIAQDAKGCTIQSDAQGAVAWCMLGAISFSLAPHLENAAKWALLDVIPPYVVEYNVGGPRRNISVLNDAATTTQADVLGWIDAAIEKVRHG